MSTLKLNDEKILQWVNLTIKTAINNRTILDDVTGELKSGQSLAIMGSSGAGKTTLLNYISQINKNVLKGLTKSDGTIKFISNNIDETKSYNLLSGYVTQNEILFEILTPRELFTFVADLRLPMKTKKEKEILVENLIIRLGLEKCADTQVGTVLSKCLSGGERKRTSIGCELISDPMILFLDEPTTGLDSVSAYNVVKLITEEAKLNNRIVIFTIHQPSSECFTMFDQLLLLSNGKVAFHGDSKYAMEFFYKLGYECPSNCNPAEYYIKILSKEDKYVEKLSESLGLKTNDNLNKHEQAFTITGNDYINNKIKDESSIRTKHNNKINEEASCQNTIITNVGKTKKKKVDDDASLEFRRSISNLEDNPDEIEKENLEYMETLINFSNHARNNLQISDLSSCRINENKIKIKRNNFFIELMYLCKRNNKNMFRNKQGFFLRVIMTIFSSILINLVFNSIQNGDNSVIDRNGCLFFITFSVISNNLQLNLMSIVLEKDKFYKDQDSSMYGVLPYFISKTILEIPIQLIFALIIFGLNYFSTGLNRSDYYNYFIFVLIIWVSGYAGSTVAYFVSCLFDDKQIIPAIFPLIYYAQIQAAGYSSSLKNIPYILYPLKYISIFRYCYQSLAWNEYNGLTQESLNCKNEFKCKFPTDDFQENLEWSLLAQAIAIGILNVVSVIALKVKINSRKIK